MPQQSTVYVGVDPGVKGGIACIRNGQIAAVAMQSLTLSGMWDWFRKFLPEPDRYKQQEGYSLYQQVASGKSRTSAFAVIEKVGGFIGDSGEGEESKKRNRAAAHTMFTFGASFGGLRMCLVAAEIPFEEVLPRVWQRGLGIPARTKGESVVDYKRRLKEVAQRLFPRQSITLATSDAILMAEFNRRKREGCL